MRAAGRDWVGWLSGWVRPRLRLGMWVLGLMVLGWWCLPRPALYPEGMGWSRLVRDRDGGVLHLAMASDGRYRLWTSLGGIHPRWVEATLAKEDRWFYRHPGVNPAALVRAAVGVLTGNAAGGASTLTMQVARLRWRLETRSVVGKLVQIGRALQLERHYGKEAILEAYFNLAPYGGNVEGAGAAAWLWCGCGPGEVSGREAVALSVIPQSPSARQPGRPGAERRIAVAQARLVEVMERRSGMRADPLAAEFSLAPVGLPPHEAPHFCRRVMRDVSGAEVVSTLDARLQQGLEEGIAEHLARVADDGVVNACAVLVHAPTREVLGYVGSAAYGDRAIQGMVDGLGARRSPGSALKPFIYGLALEQGLIHPRSLLVDAPRAFGDYNPENYGRGFMGPVLAGEALARSRNLPAVDLANRLKGDGLYGLLKRGGVGLAHSAGHYGLSLALGGVGVTPLELAGLYAALAADGVARPLVFEKGGGAGGIGGGGVLLSEEARFLVLEMLRGEGVGAAGMRVDPRVAWKTGTSHGFRDAWAVGVWGEHALLVWLGNFDGKGNPALVAARCAAPLLFGLFERLALPEVVRPVPEGVRKVALCAVSGGLPGPVCRQTVEGWFIPGVSPIAPCGLHRRIWVDGVSGLRVARDDGRAGLREEVHEVWPPELLELFRQAGLPRRVPPRPEAMVDTLAGLDHGQAPVITSPLGGRIYPRRGESVFEIELRARAAAGVRQLYWFCGEAFLGADGPEGGVAWRPGVGEHEVRVMDDAGRAASVTVSVR